MPSPKKQFDAQRFLAIIGEGRRLVRLKKKQQVYMQGAKSDALYYVQKGKVKLTVLSKRGKEATIAILNETDFFGEGGLAGQPLRMSSATAMTDAN